MIQPVTRQLAANRRWLRVADAGWSDPLDPEFARQRGGRWNPPRSHATLYLNENIETARSQIRHMLEGSPVRPDDLADRFVLVAATLPSRQTVANAISDDGLKALDLPSSYPKDYAGEPIGHDTCQPIGAAVKSTGQRGLHARSAATPDGTGRELAWFPARRTSKATPEGEPIPFSTWFYEDSGVVFGNRVPESTPKS